MSAFCRVDVSVAGPNALGILIPPGRSTLLIVRPRALDWDLVAVSNLAKNGIERAFLQLSRDDAARQAQDLFRSLEVCARGETGVVEVLRASSGGFCVEAAIGMINLVACGRVPGQAYRPMVFAGQLEARRAAEQIAALFHPPVGTQQEIYVNTQNFQM